jgi:hypothetical protein
MQQLPPNPAWRLAPHLHPSAIETEKNKRGERFPSSETERNEGAGWFPQLDVEERGHARGSPSSWHWNGEEQEGGRILFASKKVERFKTLPNCCMSCKKQKKKRKNAAAPFAPLGWTHSLPHHLSSAHLQNVPTDPLWSFRSDGVGEACEGDKGRCEKSLCWTQPKIGPVQGRVY